MGSIEERLDFLEKEYERLYHTYDLLSIYIPKMCDFLDDYLSKAYEFRSDVLSDINNAKDLVRLIDRDIQEHFKFHIDKEKKVFKTYE